MLDQTVCDFRVGLRSLSRTPGLTLVAVLSLALGIGAATAMFSTIHAVVIDPFPYKDVDSLMSIKLEQPGQRGYRTYYTPDQYLAFAERSTIFEDVTSSTISDVLMSGDGEPERLRGNYVTADPFKVMGVPPVYGRVLGPADMAPDAPLAAVLGYRFWQRRFAGEPSVIGRQLRLNEKVYTVVGVMPKRFMWRGADVYLPVMYRRGEVVEGVRVVHLVGRLKPGVTEAQISADLRPIVEDLRRENPLTLQLPDNYRVGVLSFKETFPSGIREELWILFGAVGLLLLIACANVSNLLLSKAAARRKEMAVRAALGAGRRRLLRQLFTESFVLAAAGSALGIGLAWIGIRAVLALVPPFTIPDESEITINIPVLLFALGVCVATSLLFGLAPAFQASSKLANPLRESGRGNSGSRGQAWLRSVLVVSEVALSLVLLVGSGLMIRTLLNIQRSDPAGVPPDRVLTLRVPLTLQRYPTHERRAVLLSQAIERIGALPGVRSVAINSGFHPFAGGRVQVEAPSSQAQDKRPVLLHRINPAYLKLAGVPLIAGRPFNDAEVAARHHLALVNQAFVARYFSGSDPLGAMIRIPALSRPPMAIDNDQFQIAGITADVENQFQSTEIMPEIYIPYSVHALPDRLLVHSGQDPTTLANAVRAQIYALDKDQPVMDVRTVRQFLQDFIYATPRFNLFLLSVFASIGLVLAVVGVYGVISHYVTRQTQEIGVRIALGAGLGEIARMVLSRGLRLLLVGTVIGLAGSAALMRLIQRQLWQVSPFDPLSFAGAAAVLVGIGLLACWWPARRAARVDPVTALRYE